jgi:hypothetical protein
LLGISEEVPWHKEGDKTIIELPLEFNNKIPCDYAFSFKIEQEREI